MKAAVLFERNRPLVLKENDIDEPGPGEAVVKTAATGVRTVRPRVDIPRFIGSLRDGPAEAG